MDDGEQLSQPRSRNPTAGESSKGQAALNAATYEESSPMLKTSSSAPALASASPQRPGWKPAMTGPVGAGSQFNTLLWCKRSAADLVAEAQLGTLEDKRKARAAKAYAASE